MTSRASLVLAAVAVSAATVHADAWKWKSVRRFDPPANCWISDVAFDGDRGLAVNSAAYAFVSADRGRNWTSHNAATLMTPSSALLACAVKGRRMWAAGERALIYSTDGGRTWRRGSQPVTGWWTIRALDFDPADPRMVAAVGGRKIGGAWRPLVLISDDGGATWTQTSAPATSVLIGVRYRPAGRTVVCSSAGVYASTDGGSTWAAVSSPALQGLSPRCMVSQKGYVWIGGASGRIAYSADAGATWQSESLGANRAIDDMAFLTPAVGIAVARPNYIYHTLDGGRTWVADTVSPAYQDLGCAAVRRSGRHYFLVGGRRYNIPVALADQDARIPFRLLLPARELRYPARPKPPIRAMPRR